MTTNNKPKHLTINHREPTKEELSAQMDREEQLSIGIWIAVRMPPAERDALTELMFQRTAVDFDLLNRTLSTAGFCDVEKVRGFGLFNDTSAVAFRGERLPLNVVARACRKEGQAITVQFPGMET